MKTLLSVDHLTVAAGGRILQRDVSFKIKEGDIFVIRGKNGVGKSSLINTLLSPKGSCKGKFVWHLPNREIAYLPQIIEGDFPIAITLGEIMHLFSLLPEVENLLPPSLWEQKWSDASGGERQKTLILTRLQKNIRFLILDEPFNHIDQKNIAALVKLLTNWVQEQRAILIVSHRPLEQTHGRELILQ